MSKRDNFVYIKKYLMRKKKFHNRRLKAELRTAKEELSRKEKFIDELKKQ
jgi:hypothetical protein